MCADFASPVRISDSVTPLTPDEEHKIDAYWRAANYCPSVKSIFTTIRCFASR